MSWGYAVKLGKYVHGAAGNMTSVCRSVEHVSVWNTRSIEDEAHHGTRIYLTIQVMG